MVENINTQIAYNPQADSLNTPNGKDDPASDEFKLFGDDGFTFWDFVDMVNPLQHLPLVSTAYREMTGDQLDPGARLAGGTLYGGPIGLAASAFNVVLEHNTGKDAGEHVVAWFEDGEEVPVEGGVMTAENQSSQRTTQVASFAPLYPDSEAEAFAAGEASLRMADLQDFMDPALATEVPVGSSGEEVGAGSIGAWTPPLETHHPFPTERPTNAAPQPSFDVSSVQRPTEPPAYSGFQAQQTHDEALDALRAFARDINGQNNQNQEIQQVPTNTPPVTTAQLAQTTDNSWFAQMMSQNMTRYDDGVSER